MSVLEYSVKHCIKNIVKLLRPNTDPFSSCTLYFNLMMRSARCGELMVEVLLYTVLPVELGCYESYTHMLQAMAIMAIPQNAPDALSNLVNLTDEIWYRAGDSSTDVRALF